MKPKKNAPVKVVLPVKDPENLEALNILKSRRQMDRTQIDQGNSLIRVGTYRHIKNQSLNNMIKEPSGSALNIYSELFDDKKKIKGEFIRKPKVKDLNLIEGVHDE
jgi:hypothetical protein